MTEAEPDRKSWSTIATYASENAIRLAIAAFVGVLVARYLGPASLGLLSFATSIFGLIVPFATLGMRSILIRDISTTDDWRPLLVAGLSRQLPIAVLGSLAGAFIVATSRDFSYDSLTIAICLMPLPVLALSDTLRALLEAQAKAKRIAVVGLTAAVITSAFKLLAIILGYPIWAFALLTTVEAGLVAAGLLWGRVKRGVIGSIRHHYSRDVATGLLRESWPLLLASLAVTLYMRVDIAMMGVIGGDAEAGIYVAAARISEVWYFFPVAIAAALRPRLARLFKQANSEAYRRLTQRFLTGSVAVSIVIAVVTLVLADPAVAFLYGTEFAAASSVLKIHVFAAPFVFLGVAASQWFVDQGMTRQVMARSSAGALINIALNFVLIPALGASGAAISTLVAYGLAAFLLNGLMPSTRPLFLMQIKAFRGAWK